MEKEAPRLFILGIVLLIAGLAQCSGAATIFGVAPNAILVVIVMAALFLRDVWHTLLLLSVALFLLKFSPIAGHDIVTFFLVGVALITGERTLPWHPLVNGMFLVSCATVVLYVFIDRSALLSLSFVLELGYNTLITSVLYYALTSFRLFRHR